MKKICLAFALAASALPSMAATSVGVSIGIDQPGVYGRIDIGRVPALPVLVYAQPVVIVPSPVAQYQSPIYLRVPVAQTRDWRHHCSAYGACNRPVYFVQETWYRDHYARHYVQQPVNHGSRYDDRGHGKGKGKGHDKGRGNGKGHSRN
jgi:hypothetical protein